MGKHPVIGLNMSLEFIEGENRWELQTPLTYVDAVMGAGGLPLLIPPYGEPAMIREMIPMLDGIVFIGGNDYRPDYYGGHAQPEGELIPERRDRFDLALAKWILKETALPVFGICGGHQLLAIAQGGVLIQDIKTEWPSPEGISPILHAKRERSKADQGNFRHSVGIKTGSLVAGIVKTPSGERLDTNSFHHQAVHPDTPGRNFMVSAWTADGIVEAIEPSLDSTWARSGRFVLGVQWHPERMQDEKPQRRLFSALVAAAGQHKRR
jgi:putative glutamine amidotransferase